MKKLIILILPLLILTSCQVSEEIYFNKDGSGIYNLKMDMNGMAKMMKGLAENDSIQYKRAPEKSDTIILFADILKMNNDSIVKLPKEDREFLESMKDAKMHIHLDEAKDEMFLNYEIPFKKIEDLTNIEKKFNKLNSYNNKGVKGMGNEMFPGYQISYKFNKRGFHRVVKKIKDVENKQVLQDTKMLNMIQYEIIYHFPYKIDNVSYKDALIGADGKSLHIKVPLDSLIKNPKMLDFEVKFR